MLYDMPIAINTIASFILYTDDIFTHPPATSVQQSTPSTFSASAHLSSSSSSYAIPSSAAAGLGLSSTLPGPLSTQGKRAYNSATL